VLLVGPRDDGRALDERLRRRPDSWTELLQGGDHTVVSGHEPGPISGHGRPLAERVEGDDVPASSFERRRRRLLEPELRVRLVRREQEVVRVRQLGQPVVEAARRGGSSRVVGVVDPDDRRLLPRLLADRREVGEEVVLRQQRHGGDTSVREQRTALVHRVGRIGDEHEVLAADGVDDDLCEREDRLLAAVRRDDLPVRVDVDTEAASEPGGDRRAQLR
jgi:hypothetical protein